MTTLQDTLRDLVPRWREEKSQILKDKGAAVLTPLTVAQAFGGMRGVKAMVCDTSEVKLDKGLFIRGHHVLDIMDLWPEQTFILLLTGEISPLDSELVKDLQREMDQRAELPGYVFDVLKAMPPDSHPMTMLGTGILVMERESRFRAEYAKGMVKEDYWVPMLDDALTLMARMPVLAAAVYRLHYGKGDAIPWTPGLDHGANFAKMLGLDDPTGDFAKLMRLYVHLHSDHEGGNVSAFVCHSVGSALADVYYSVSAGLNALAGPLHGLANQECLGWILALMEKYGGVPDPEQIREHACATLHAGEVIPGYGHAVLRVTDPRFIGFNRFGREHMPTDPVFMTVDRVFEVVPKCLQQYSDERVKAGKAPIANFWPNVDGGSGALLYHYGLTEFDFYTVLFGVSRSMGMMAQLIWNRAVGTPITRPKSVTMKWIATQAK